MDAIERMVPRVSMGPVYEKLFARINVHHGVPVQVSARKGNQGMTTINHKAGRSRSYGSFAALLNCDSHSEILHLPLQRVLTLGERNHEDLFPKTV